MPKKQLSKWMPTPGKMRQHRSLRLFAHWFENTQLWQLWCRHTTAKAFAIGLYCAMLPVPGQMFIAVALAIVFTANVPLSFSLIFITNPLTMPAIYYAAYKLGAWILGTKPLDIEFEASLDDSQRGDSLSRRDQQMDAHTGQDAPIAGGVSGAVRQSLRVALGILGYVLIDLLPTRLAQRHPPPVEGATLVTGSVSERLGNRK